MSRYLDLLEASIKRRGGRLCVGIDPDPAHLPAAFSQDEEGLRRWCELLISISMLLSLLNYKYLDVMGGLMLTYQAKLCRERHARLIKVVVLISHLVFLLILSRTQ